MTAEICYPVYDDIPVSVLCERVAPSPDSCRVCFYDLAKIDGVFKTVRVFFPELGSDIEVYRVNSKGQAVDCITNDIRKADYDDLFSEAIRIWIDRSEFTGSSEICDGLLTYRLITTVYINSNPDDNHFVYIYYCDEEDVFNIMDTFGRELELDECMRERLLETAKDILASEESELRYEMKYYDR